MGNGQNTVAGKEKKSEDTLIDSQVSTAQCKLAIDALLEHALAHQAAKEQSELLPDRTEQYIWLVVAVKKVFPERKVKPFKIPLSHPLIDPRTTPICLITKDPQREYKDLLASHGIRFISRVVGIEKLKGKFKPFEARRMLLKESGMFLADDRVIPLLPKLLGKAFFNAKKQPVPVCLKRKDLKGELERAVSSTYFHQNQGSCSSVKIGVLGQHSSAQLLQNLSTALPHVVKNIREGWDNVQSIHIKTSSSASLPLWSCGLDEEEGGRWDGLTRVPMPDDTDERVKKGEKRTLEIEEEPGKKRKKSKVSSASASHPSRLASPPSSKSSDVKKSTPNSSMEVSTRETHVSPKSVASDSKDSAPVKSKPRGEKPSETKTILKSSKKVVESAPVDVPAKAKRVKFAAKPSDLKKRDRALGMADKKVRSGGGKSTSAKDRVLGKKVAVR